MLPPREPFLRRRLGGLKVVCEHMVEGKKRFRKEVSKRIGRIKRAFKWAASEELLPPSVFEGLRSVDGLRMERTTARETPPVRLVDDQRVDASLPFLSPHVAAMVQLQPPG